MSEQTTSSVRAPEFRKPDTNPFSSARLLLWLCSGLISIFLLGTQLGPIAGGGDFDARTNGIIQNSHLLIVSLILYATKHDGKFPEGHSSTEVFQKLLDEGELVSSSVYFPLPGKTAPVPGQPLKPENVSWDITSTSSPDDTHPDELPLVFMTGCRVDYAADGTARLLGKPYHAFEARLTWSEWWTRQRSPIAGIVVARANGRCWFERLDPSTNSIPNFIGPNTTPDSANKYRQLTPDGALP